MKKVLKILNTRLTFALTIVLFQIIIAYLFFSLLSNGAIFSILTLIAEIVLILVISNRDANATFNLAWLVVIAIVPIFGVVIYLLYANRSVPKPLRSDFLIEMNNSYGVLKQDRKVKKSFKDDNQLMQAEYVLNNASFPYWNNTECKYYPLGEEFFDDMIEKINNAKKFIFCEFFIVDKGELFDRFKEALIKKANTGIPVYFMYDDAGCMNISKVIKKELVDAGIKVTVFNPISLHVVLLAKTNNRDHRKICVVDNEYGYTGGYNLADEYINKKEKYGLWKDSGVRIKGNAVNNLTVMFIQFYNAHNVKRLDYKSYLLKNNIVSSTSIVLPFSDSPVDKENVSKTVHFNMISKAKKYIYIQTPYLVLDDVIFEALVTAKKNGVEVIITIPNIPDKITVHKVTENNCYKLIKQGIKVYKFTPGFIHSKMIIVDDEIAINGTVNMDLRSYYLNYENGILIFNDPEIKKMKKDFMDVLSSSKPMTKDDYNNLSFVDRLVHAFMTIFAPLF